jgi:hypothetical protein
MLAVAAAVLWLGAYFAYRDGHRRVTWLFAVLGAMLLLGPVLLLVSVSTVTESGSSGP